MHPVCHCQCDWELMCPFANHLYGLICCASCLVVALCAADPSIFRTRGIMCLTNSLHKCVCVCPHWVVFAHNQCVTNELKQSHCFHRCHSSLVITESDVKRTHCLQLRVKVQPSKLLRLHICRGTRVTWRCNVISFQRFALVFVAWLSTCFRLLELKPARKKMSSRRLRPLSRSSLLSACQ